MTSNDKIKGWLVSHRVTQGEFAQAIDVPYECVRNRLKGLTEWRLDEIKRVLAFTGETFEDLF